MNKKNNGVVIGSVVIAFCVAFYLLVIRRKTTTPTVSQILGTTPTTATNSILPSNQPSLGTNPQTYPLEIKREYLYKVLREAGISNNRCQPASELTNKFFPGHVISNNDLATFFGFYYPEVMAASGLDRKFAIINPLLQQNGINYFLKRENPTFGSVLGSLAGTAIGSIIPG